MKIKLAGVVPESIVDGPGIRYTIFVQGCPHKCEGCHNPQTHDFKGGYIADTEDIIKEISENPLLQGVTFSGGEPFTQPKPLIEIAKSVRNIGKDIVAYSGYTFEEILELDGNAVELLKLCDVLIDGRFDISQRSLALQFRGSKNQRIIDVCKSLESGEIVEKTF